MGNAKMVGNCVNVLLTVTIMQKLISITFLFVLLSSTFYVNGQGLEIDTIYFEDNVDIKPDLKYCSSGNDCFRRYAAKNVIFRQEALSNHIEGISEVSFVVYKNGSIGDIKIERSSHKLLDDAAVAVVKDFPPFSPGFKNNKPVNVRLFLPIEFNIDDFKGVIEPSFDPPDTTLYTLRKHCYYLPSNAVFCGRYFVDYQMYGGFGFLNADFDNPNEEFLKTGANGCYQLDEDLCFCKVLRPYKRICFFAGNGIRFVQYPFKYTFDLKTSTKRVFADYSSPETDKFKHHNLRLLYLTAPLGGSIRFSPKQTPCEVSLFAMGIMRIGSREAQVYEMDNARKKVAYKDDFLIRRFTYDLSIEINTSFAGCIPSFRYTISPMSFFNEGVYPQIYYQLITFGIKMGVINR